jgi:hypothetical protein
MVFQKLQKDLFDRIEIQAKGGNSSNTLVAMRNFDNDNSRCLTSVFFLSQTEIVSDIQKLIDKMKIADNRQYYYPVSSFHLTIQNIRTESIPPLYNEEDVEKAKRVFEKIIPKHKPIKCHLKGLFELPTSIAVRGYTDEFLKDLVLDLRQELIASGIPDNKKYASDSVFFCNSTICRYQTQPNGKFFETVKQYKERDFGIVTIDMVSLITTNSVASRNYTNVILPILLSSSNK